MNNRTPGWAVLAAIPFLSALSGCGARAAPAVASAARPGPEDAAALMKRAAGLEAAGRYDEAGVAYGKAGAAYEAAGKNKEQADALSKSATMYEKEADQLTAGGERGKGDPAPPTANAAPAPAALAGHAGARVTLPPLASRPGYVIGRAVFEDGRPVPQFTVSVSGYDGQVLQDSTVPSLGTAEAQGGRYALQTTDTFRHQKPVRATVVGVTAIAKIPYQGETFLMPMYPMDGKDNGPDARSFRGNSGKGVVRDFMLRMTGVRPGCSADEDTQDSYPYIYYGGVLQFDGTVSGKQGVNYEDETSLTRAFPAGSVEITLTPQGPLLDGSMGRTIRDTVTVADFQLGGNWRHRYLRNIPLGVYTATARLVLAGGETRPLHIRADIRSSFAWQPSLRVTWTMKTITGLMTRPTLYIGQ